MPNMFETHLVTIENNEIQKAPGTRQPIAGYKVFGTHVPCHLGRTGKNGDTLTLHILKKHLDLLPGQVYKGFKITDEATKYQYSIIAYPVWGGGKKHHIECALEEYR